MLRTQWIVVHDAGREYFAILGAKRWSSPGAVCTSRFVRRPHLSSPVATLHTLLWWLPRRSIPPERVGASSARLECSFANCEEKKSAAASVRTLIATWSVAPAPDSCPLPSSHLCFVFPDEGHSFAQEVAIFSRHSPCLLPGTLSA